MHRRSWLRAPALAAGCAVVLLRPASAQFIEPGIMAGASMSTITGDFGTDLKNNTGFIAGAFVRVGAMGFAVQPGVYYTTKGAKSSDFSDATGSKTQLDYIEIPVVIRIHLPMHLYVGAGPAIGIKLSCKFEESGQPSQDCADNGGPQIKSTEYTGIVEAGIAFNKISLGGRADLGLSNVAAAVQSGNASDISYKTRTISAVLEIRF